MLDVSNVSYHYPEQFYNIKKMALPKTFYSFVNKDLVRLRNKDFLLLGCNSFLYNIFT